MFGKFIPDFGRVVAQMQYDMYHVYTVDEHTLFAIGILHQIETGQLKDELPVASDDHADDRVAPGALSRDAAARHRQGPRRRPFRARREGRAETGAAPRAVGRGDRDRRLAGALAPVDEQHRLQARHRRPADDPEFRRPGAIARAAEAAAGADRRRHPRGRAQGVERLEGGACCASCTTARSTSFRAGLTVEAPRFAHRRGAGRGARAAARLQRGGVRRLHQPRLPVLLAVARCRDACPPCPADARGRCERGAAHRREAHRSGARGDRDHPLHRRSPGPLFAHRRGARGLGRQHRRRQDHDDVERHGARYALGAGP